MFAGGNDELYIVGGNDELYIAGGNDELRSMICRMFFPRDVVSIRIRIIRIINLHNP